jgi:acetyl-CoA C-acetyltransferase
MRNVAIVGFGLSKHKAKRRDVNIAELLYEAVQDAFNRTGLTPDDIDAIVFGNMHTFEGVNQPELWAAPWIAALNKPVLRVATGGTTGGTVAQAGYYHVASGMFDTVMAVAFEKQSDGNTQLGLAAIVLPEAQAMMRWSPSLAIGAAAGGGSTGGASFQAQSYCHKSGATQEHLALHVVKNRRNAAKNPYAHLRMPNLTVEDVIKTPMISFPLRYGHTCPASDGSAALIFTTEKKARKVCERPAFVLGVGSGATDPTLNPLGAATTDPSEQLAAKLAAKWAYERAGIRNPRKEIDYAEIYDPFAHQEMMWSERLGLFDENKGPEALKSGRTQMTGDLPINASGGVISTNAIGATALIRVGEAALQIMGKAGEHQVPKPVNKTVSHGWGGLFQFVCVTVLGSEPRHHEPEAVAVSAPKPAKKAAAKPKPKAKAKAKVKAKGKVRTRSQAKLKRKAGPKPKAKKAAKSKKRGKK